MVIVVNNKRMIFLLVFSILVVVIATVGVTYAYLSVNAVQTNPNTLNSTCYEVSFTDQDRINITSYPMSSATAFSKLTPYKFTITNSCEANTEYQVFLNVLNTTSSKLLPYINYSLDGSTVNKLSNPTSLPNGVTSNNASASYVIDTGTITGINASKTYNLHMWIDESAENDIMGSTFSAEITVYSVAK